MARPYGKSGASPGFTLIELLIAMAVFAVMSVMAYGGLRTLLHTRQHTDEMSQQLSQLQSAFLLIQQDMGQIVPRSVRDEYGDVEPALTTMGAASYPIIFTRGGQRSRFQKRRSALQRIAYQVEDGILYRLSWPVLDGAGDDTARRMPLLQGVEEMNFQFLGEAWDASWPPYSSQSNDDILPKAVEMQLTLEHWGSVRRLFALPQ